MQLRTIYNLTDELAPFSLSAELCEKYGMYDNSGILLDCGREITKVLFALDLSHSAIERAKQMGAELIFTHHPAIYAPVKHLIQGGEGGLILEAATAGISVLSAHLNLDGTQGGIDECLMQGLGGNTPVCVQLPLSKGSYGKVFEVEKTPLKEYAEQVKRTFQTERLLVYGEKDVQKIASFCGAGLDDKSVAFAVEQGVDTVVSSDGKHHLISALQERGVNLILLTHYSSEHYGFFRFYQKIKEKIALPCEYFTEDKLL